MADSRKPVLVRLDPVVHAAVERMAAVDMRSANAEIEVLLREALARRGVRLPVAVPVKRGRPPSSDS